MTLRLTRKQRGPRKGSSTREIARPSARVRIYARPKAERGKALPFSRARRYGWMALIGDMFVFSLTILIGLGIGFVHFARDLPDIGDLWRVQRAPQITLLAKDGTPLSASGPTYGEFVRLAELPDHVQHAVLAVEDRNFYHHVGVNPTSVMRAFLVNTREGAVRQGGSTITQQLVKNVLLTPERTITRKIQEMLLALAIEREYTKEEILTLYINRVYFGAGAYGIDAASRRYFAKPAAKLNVAESALLAGLLKAPSRYAPTNDPGGASRRGGVVLDKMVRSGFLSEQEAHLARLNGVYVSDGAFSQAQYFSDYAMGQAKRLLAGVDADVVVHTTFDPVIHQNAQAGVDTSLKMLDPLTGGAQLAAVVMDDRGAVRSLIGGRDYRQSQFNRAAQARRQPGSAFKPFIYLAAMERGMRPDDYAYDAPLSIGNWSPTNYKDKFFGQVTLREAMARSLNSVAIRLQEQTGRARVRMTARAMGIDQDLSKGPSLGLGVDALSPLTLAGAYAPFSNGGLRATPYVVAKITTVDGDVVYQHNDGVAVQVASPAAIAGVNDLLINVVRWGSGRRAHIEGWQVAGKTGTTQNNRDAWFVGYAGGLVSAIWVGHDNNAPMLDATGGKVGAQLWHDVMAQVLGERVTKPLREQAPTPQNLVASPVYAAPPDPPGAAVPNLAPLQYAPQADLYHTYSE